MARGPPSATVASRLLRSSVHVYSKGVAAMQYPPNLRLMGAGSINTHRPWIENNRPICSPPVVIELTTELSVLNLYCPFCGKHTYDWTLEDCVTHCPHLIQAEYGLQNAPTCNHELGDVVFCIFDSGPRPEMLTLIFRDQPQQIE